MKRFMLLHFGFERPTPQIMEKWNQWFTSIKAIQVEQGGFSGGRELSEAGEQDLPWDQTSITGYNIIEAENMSAAVQIAKTNPFISSIRIYELRS